MTSDWLFWLAGGLLGIAGLWLSYWALLSDRAKGRKRCSKCWYDMQGAEGLRCPECGHTAKGQRKLHKTRRRWRFAFVAVAVLLGATSLGLTPKVRNDGWMSITPTTALILIQRHRQDIAAYVEIIGRIRVRQPDGTVQFPHSALSRRQWEMLAETCVHTMSNADDPDAFDYSLELLRGILTRGIRPPEDFGNAVVALLENPPPWRAASIRFVLRREDFRSWLGDDYARVHRIIVMRLQQTIDPDEANFLAYIVFSARGTALGIVELLAVMPGMTTSACAADVIDDIVFRLLEAAKEGQVADDDVLDGLVSVASSEHEEARHWAQFLLLRPQFVDPGRSLLALHRAVELDDPTVSRERVQRLILLLEALKQGAVPEKLRSGDPSAHVIYARIAFTFDFEFGVFLIRHYLGAARPGETDNVLGTLLADEGATQLCLRILTALAQDSEPEIRMLVPAFASELAARVPEANQLVERLRKDNSLGVRTEAERVRR